MAYLLKLSSVPEIKHEVIIALQDGKNHKVKISTTKKIITQDRLDARLINSFNNVKIVFKKKDGGVLVLIGNLQCDFRAPMGGAFYLKKIVEDTTDFKSIQGYDTEVQFITIGNPTSINDMHAFFNDLNNDDDFEFNIGQFDEFMELFEFYKRLSNELNNNITYKVNNISRPYYFLASDVKGFDSEFKEEVKDQNGVLKGYKFSENEYMYLKNEIKEQVKELIDVYIDGNSEELAKIRRIGADNIYLSNTYEIRNEQEIKNLKQFSIVNTYISKKEVILSGELKKSIDYEEDYRFVNLYDMGQKIKIESIDNSLRLINQGATGAASELLQYLIGDEKMLNKKKRDITKEKEKYIQGLNESQKEAFLMATDGSPVSLIKGPPGTGKTHVINSIVQYITKELNQKVIVSSQTHIAIDNVLDKLVENYDLVIPNRITNRKNRYSGEYIDETLYRTWGSKFESHNDRVSDDALKKAMLKSMNNFNGEHKFKYSENMNESEYSVIGATTTTSAIAGKKGLEVLKGYDWLIIDEVSKCPITEVLRYLPYVSKIIMVGDDYQLAPLLEFSKDDVKHLSAYDDDLFEKLQTMYEQSVFSKVLEKAKKYHRLVLLNENYRSVEQILKTYNVFYDGELVGKREVVKPNKVHFYNDNTTINFESNDVMFVEVLGGQENRDGTSRFNIEEIKATEYVLKELMKCTINPEKVSVSAIFPYAAQINHFQKNNVDLINNAKKIFKSFEIDTVDAFQGKETDIVLVNTVITDLTQRNFLNDFRRINVSMSRARDKLIVFGNSFALSKINMKITGGKERRYFKEIIDYISAQGKKIKYEGGKVEDGNKSKNIFKLA